jgi:MFS superfamily sulfate permease-like transporter
LVGVVFATAVAQFLSIPVRYVDLPDSLLGSIAMPEFSGFARLGELQFIIASLTLAFVASAETLLSATAVDQMHDGPRTRYNRELMSQGVGNTICGFLGGLPMTGVIVRSATNVAAGAKTRRSAIFHGLWLLVLVAAAPGVLRAVPVASLAAILRVGPTARRPSSGQSTLLGPRVAESCTCRPACIASHPRRKTRRPSRSGTVA